MSSTFTDPSTVFDPPGKPAPRAADAVSPLVSCRSATHPVPVATKTSTEHTTTAIRHHRTPEGRGGPLGPQAGPAEEPDRRPVPRTARTLPAPGREATARHESPAGAAGRGATGARSGRAGSDE